MGNLAAKIIKRAGRPFKNFAVEARTERLLERKKPSAAPWHPTTQKRIEELMAESQDFLQDQSKKDAPLDKRLKDIYVTSQDVVFPQIETPMKPLPVSRGTVEPPELGYQEPSTVTKGKLTMRSALLMLGRHQQDASLNTPGYLANEFTIHPQKAENILKYFKTFEYYEPPSSKSKSKLVVSDYLSYKQITDSSKSSASDETATSKLVEGNKPIS